MKQIFKDSRLHDEYETKGFVTIPLLDEGKVRDLKNLYLSTIRSEVKGLYTSHSHCSGALNLQMHDAIGGIMVDPIREMFRDFDFVVNHFVVKSNINSEEFRLHQDWNIVDEERTQAAHIWCPLSDVSESNGGLFVIPGSHRHFNNLRSGSLGIAFVNRTPFINGRIFKLNLRAGEAIVYKQALFHGSFPNRSQEPRIVALSSIKEMNAKWLYYHAAESFEHNKTVEVFNMNTETFLNQLSLYEKGRRPEGMSVIETFFYDRILTHSINEDLLVSRMREHTNNDWQTA